MNIIERLFHKQYECDDSLVYFRCRECGFVSLSIGGLHGHAEQHRGYTRFNIQVPFTRTYMGRFGRLMDYTEVVMVEKEREIELDEVDGL